MSPVALASWLVVALLALSAGAVLVEERYELAPVQRGSELYRTHLLRREAQDPSSTSASVLMDAGVAVAGDDMPSEKLSVQILPTEVTVIVNGGESTLQTQIPGQKIFRALEADPNSDPRDPDRDLLLHATVLPAKLSFKYNDETHTFTTPRQDIHRQIQPKVKHWTVDENFQAVEYVVKAESKIVKALQAPDKDTTYKAVLLHTKVGGVDYDALVAERELKPFVTSIAQAMVRNLQEFSRKMVSVSATVTKGLGSGPTAATLVELTLIVASERVQAVKDHLKLANPTFRQNVKDSVDKVLGLDPRHQPWRAGTLNAIVMDWRVFRVDENLKPTTEEDEVAEKQDAKDALAEEDPAEEKPDEEGKGEDKSSKGDGKPEKDAKDALAEEDTADEKPDEEGKGEDKSRKDDGKAEKDAKDGPAKEGPAEENPDGEGKGEDKTSKGDGKAEKEAKGGAEEGPAEEKPDEEGKGKDEKSKGDGKEAKGGAEEGPAEEKPDEEGKGEGKTSKDDGKDSISEEDAPDEGIPVNLPSESQRKGDFPDPEHKQTKKDPSGKEGKAKEGPAEESPDEENPAEEGQTKDQTSKGDAPADKDPSGKEGKAKEGPAEESPAEESPAEEGQTKEGSAEEGSPAEGTSEDQAVQGSKNKQQVASLFQQQELAHRRPAQAPRPRARHGQRRTGQELRSGPRPKSPLRHHAAGEAAQRRADEAARNA